MVTRRSVISSGALLALGLLTGCGGDEVEEAGADTATRIPDVPGAPTFVPVDEAAASPAAASGTPAGEAPAGEEPAAEAVAASPAAAPAGQAGGGPVEIAAWDIGWEYNGQRTTASEPITVPVTPGQVISLPNTGAAQHNFAVEAFDNVVVDMPVGETVEYTVPEGTEPGPYDFICTIAGHAQAGMVGVLDVQEAGAAPAPAGDAAASPAPAADAAAPAAGADTPVEIVGVDIAWEYNGVRSTTAEPARVEVAPGQTISLPNAGGSPHNFAVEAFGNVVVDMPVGETVEYTVPAETAPGEYDFICTIAGHAQAGMVGVLVVQ